MEEGKYYIVQERKLWEQEGIGIYNSRLENLQIMYGLFELIEEDTIDSIEEYKTTYTERCIDIEVREKINEIIKKVNQIDKQIKELKK